MQVPWSEGRGAAAPCAVFRARGGPPCLRLRRSPVRRAGSTTRVPRVPHALRKEARTNGTNNPQLAGERSFLTRCSRCWQFRLNGTWGFECRTSATTSAAPAQLNACTVDSCSSVLACPDCFAVLAYRVAASRRPPKRSACRAPRCAGWSRSAAPLPGSVLWRKHARQRLVVDWSASEGITARYTL